MLVGDGALCPSPCPVCSYVRGLDMVVTMLVGSLCALLGFGLGLSLLSADEGRAWVMGYREGIRDGARVVVIMPPVAPPPVPPQYNPQGAVWRAQRRLCPPVQALAQLDGDGNGEGACHV